MKKSISYLLILLSMHSPLISLGESANSDTPSAYAVNESIAKEYSQNWVKFFSIGYLVIAGLATLLQEHLDMEELEM